MRTIKFRGKTTINGHWVYGGLVDYGNNAFAIRNHKSNPWVQPETVGQFTGMLDRNGKEIYEGDILSVPDGGNVGPEFIIFKDGCFQVRGDWYTRTLNRVDTLKRTIIGNIHDNPELLKGDEQ